MKFLSKNRKKKDHVRQAELAAFLIDFVAYFPDAAIGLPSLRNLIYIWGKILFSEVEVSLWSTALVVCRTGTRRGSSDI